MSGGGSSGDSTTTIVKRYAEYIETQHQDFLSHITSTREELLGDSPYRDYVEIEIEEAFFATGLVLSSYPSLFDSFGKYMAALDIEAIWSESFSSVMNKEEINEAVEKEMVEIDKEVFEKKLPEFMLRMRELNAVQSTSFVIGKSVIEDSRVRMLGKVIGDKTFPLLPETNKHLRGTLNWQKDEVWRYALGMKLYLVIRLDVDKVNDKRDVKDKLWDLDVLHYELVALSAMTGAKGMIKKHLSPRERSAISKGFLVLSYTATGAYIGSQIYPGIGTAIGAAIGAIVGIAAMLLE